MYLFFLVSNSSYQSKVVIVLNWRNFYDIEHCSKKLYKIIIKFKYFMFKKTDFVLLSCFKNWNSYLVTENEDLSVKKEFVIFECPLQPFSSGPVPGKRGQTSPSELDGGREVLDDADPVLPQLFNHCRISAGLQHADLRSHVGELHSNGLGSWCCLTCKI